MIQCIIDGHTAYPLSTSSIKVTYANQYVTDDGEYTYDITFPMDILANREIFHNVSRFEVKKSVSKYDDCKLYCNGLLIMSGVGTILSVTQKEVKLQIVGGKSRIKFNDKMTKHYIDEIDLGTASEPGMKVTNRLSDTWKFIYNVKDLYQISDDRTKFLGVQGKWCFMPVRDETNDMIANFVGVDHYANFTDKENGAYLQNIAVQPSLMYLFKKVVEYEGYRLVRNDLDVKPWNLLYIASAFKSLELRRALPHWSCYTFIEEFRKLFNATIHFDDIKRTCEVISTSELDSSDCVSITPLEEYTTDYDEDGSFSTSSTANLEYNLGDSANRGDYEVITKKIFENFEVFHSTEIWGYMKQFGATTIGWSEKKKRQTIIENYSQYYIYTEDTDGNKKWQNVGFFSPLIRDKSSDDYVDLNISPAAQVVEDVNFVIPFPLYNNVYEKRCLLSVPNDKESDTKDSDIDEEGYSYVSVQDALDDDSTIDKSEDDQECMPIFFILPGRVQNTDKPYGRIGYVGEHSRWPQFLTDYNINRDYRYPGISVVDYDLYSLSLNPVGDGAISLGEMQRSGIKIDNKNSIEVKFQSDDIPDPSKTFIIQGKKYVCEKIEVEIKDDGIEPIKTGYFYMMS